MTEPKSVQHPAPESGATVEPTDDLRRAVIHAIARRQSLAAKPGGDPADLADAAIEVYRAHPDGAAADRDAAVRALSEEGRLRGQAEAERDVYRTRLKIEGVCMTCVLGAPEHYGCTDCLNTGYDGGRHPSYFEGPTAGWIAGRDAAAAWCDRFRHPDQGGGLAGSLADGIRALTPPEDK